VNYALVATGYAKVYIYGGKPFRCHGVSARAVARALGEEGTLGRALPGEHHDAGSQHAAEADSHADDHDAVGR
jgi:hypothetical protein